MTYCIRCNRRSVNGRLCVNCRQLKHAWIGESWQTGMTCKTCGLTAKTHRNKKRGRKRWYTQYTDTLGVKRFSAGYCRQSIAELCRTAASISNALITTSLTGEDWSRLLRVAEAEDADLHPEEDL